MSRIGDLASEICKEFISLPGTTGGITVEDYLKVRERAELELARYGNRSEQAPAVSVIGESKKQPKQEPAKMEKMTKASSSKPKMEKEEAPVTKEETGEIGKERSAFDILREIPDAWN